MADESRQQRPGTEQRDLKAKGRTTPLQEGELVFNQERQASDDSDRITLDIQNALRDTPPQKVK